MSTETCQQDASNADSISLTVLLADDDKDSRDFLKILLANAGHRVIEAENGQQAIDLYKEHKPDIVLMDVLMPIVDGYEATKIIKALDENNHVPLLFITSLTDDESLLKCIEAGGDDFISKPYNAIFFYAKLNAHARIRQLTAGLKKRNDLLDFFRRTTEKEHKIAERVFGKRIAKGQQENPYIQHHLSSMAIFNGDIFQSITTKNGDIYFMLGDFTGHGLAAATGTLPVSDTFITLVNENQSISIIARAINSLLKEILPSDMFCAATIIRFCPGKLSFEVWGGGLPFAFIVNRQNKTARVLESQHMPLGILNDAMFDDATTELTLTEDDSLYLYTDGITETLDENNEMYGEERLKQILIDECENPNIIASILDDVDRYTTDAEQQDDISIIRISCRPIE